MSKRKASNADISDDTAASSGQRQPQMSLDLSNNKTTPKVIATALLALLPPGATKHDAASKKLLRAYALLTAEVDARSNAMAKANVPPSPPPFSEIVNASEVNKAWLNVSRMPVLWERLDASNGLSNRDRKMNQTILLALLGRPQFANLKFIALPFKLRLKSSTIASIAKMCPHLETWDVGYGKGTGRGKDCDLVDAAEKFTKLTSIRTNMWDVTASGIASAAKVMGDQLVDLRVKNEFNHRSLSDASLAIIAEHCPNLKHFAYDCRAGEHSHASLTGVGFMILIRGCRRLEVLELKNVSELTRRDFESILNMLAQDRGSFALRQIDVVGYPFIIRSNPLSIV
ncbi:hypothetical protein ACHAWU_001110 [Discostella pseudostelligera]|uniref:Uncharacterized protein n=1 Tax=Discostella pseudostelligera TaxID=259834 RepID=A0ABD3MGB6_9STRA